jgi:hypothetical protein
MVVIVIRKRILLVICLLLVVPLIIPEPTLARTNSFYYYENLQVNLYRDTIRISASFDTNRLEISGFDPQINSLYEMQDLHIYFSTNQGGKESGEGPGPTLGLWSEVSYSSIEEDEAKDRARIINYLIEQQFGVKLEVHGNTKQSGGNLIITSFNETRVDYYGVLKTFQEILPNKSFGALFSEKMIQTTLFSQIHLYLRPKSEASPYFQSFIEITSILDSKVIPIIEGKHLFDLGEIIQLNGQIYRYERSDKSIISIFFPGEIVEDEILPEYPGTKTNNFYSFSFPEKIKSISYVKANYTVKKFPIIRATKTVDQYMAEPSDEIIVETFIENVGTDIAYNVELDIEIPEGGKLHSDYTSEQSWKQLMPGDNVTYSYILKLSKQRIHSLIKPDQVTYASTNKSHDQTEEKIYSNEILVSTRENAPLLIITKESEASVISNTTTTIKLNIKNVGNEEITDIEISEDLWYGTVVKQPKNSTISGTVLRITLPKLNPGESTTLEYVVALKNDVVSFATLSYGDTSLKSNEISLKIDQTFANELTWTYHLKIEKKAFPSTVMPGQIIFINVTVFNSGIEATPTFNVIDRIPSKIGSKDLKWENLHLGPRESLTLTYKLEIPLKYHVEGYDLPPVEVYSSNYKEIYGTSNVLHLNQNIIINSWVLAGITIAFTVVLVELIYIRKKYILVKI